MPTIQLWLGAERLTAEMALTEDQERTGMMFRTHIGENEGMIFVLPTQQGFVLDEELSAAVVPSPTSIRTV